MLSQCPLNLLKSYAHFSTHFKWQSPLKLDMSPCSFHFLPHVACTSLKCLILCCSHGYFHLLVSEARVWVPKGRGLCWHVYHHTSSLAKSIACLVYIWPNSCFLVNSQMVLLVPWNLHFFKIWEYFIWKSIGHHVNNSLILQTKYIGL